MFNTHAVEVFGRVRYEPHDFEINWTAPGFDKDASVRLALTQQGQLVGYCFVSDNYEP